MKNILYITLLLFLTAPVLADKLSIGGKELNIPSPQGYSRVTQQMDAVYRMSLHSADPLSDQLGYYIPETDIPIAMSGKTLSLNRYYILKVNKKLKDIVVSDQDFAELKSLTKSQNNEILRSVKSQVSALLKKTSKEISKELDVDFAIQMTKMVPLEPHYETDNAYAYSAYINYGASVNGSKENVIISTTVTYVNVSGKILFLYCYGSQKDLEWTRNTSKAWTANIIDSNPPSPSRLSSNSGIRWDKVLAKVIVGAIVGSLIALIYGVFARFKKKKA